MREKKAAAAVDSENMSQERVEKFKANRSTLAPEVSGRQKMSEKNTACRTQSFTGRHKFVDVKTYLKKNTPCIWAKASHADIN